MYEYNEALNILSVNQPVSLNLGNDSSLLSISYNQTEPVEYALNTVCKNLTYFFNSPHFEANMQTAFGSQWELDQGATIVEALAVGENLPVIAVLPPDLMNDVNGGFDSLTGSIYLNQTLINDHSALVDVLTEELGHYIDSLLNPTDTPGDEGELFSHLVRGDTLTKEQVLQLQQQSDRSFIFGGLVEIEASGKASFSKAKNFDVLQSSVFDSPRSVAVADFNSDDILDLAVANEGFSSGSVSVLLGNGDGSFSNAANVATGSLSRAVAPADFNNDGLSDLVVVNGNSNNVSILLGKGNGEFSKATNFAAGKNPTSVAVTDFNDDGSLDLAVANSNNVSILLGKGNGKFSKATNFAVGSSPDSVVVADFNGDGSSDLAVANYSNIFILLGKGNGKFSRATNLEVGGQSLAASDFNGDGISDLAVAAGSYFSGSVSVLLGKGDGSFGEATSLDTKRTGSISVAVEDFNGDGISDLAVANESYFNPQLSSVSVLLGKGDGSFTKATNFAVKAWPHSLAVGDFNGDAIPDLTTNNTSGVSILFNTTKIATINPKITISNTKITEGNKGRKNALFTVNLDGESDETLKVEYATANDTATAGTDYRKVNGTLTFKPGQTQKTVTVPVFGDTIDEKNETFNLNLSKPQNAELEDKLGVATIRDNDKQPAISIHNQNITEGNKGSKNALFNVTLDEASGKTVKVNYTTADDTAKSGQDYRKTRGTLTFKPGQTKQTITVPILGDTLEEANEKFTVNLSKPQNAKLRKKRGTGKIRDND